MEFQQVGFILLAGIALGSAAPAVRLGMMEIHPVTLVALRFAIATLAFAVTLQLGLAPVPGQA